MITIALLASASVLLSANSTPYSDARPPAVFQHDTTVTLDLFSQKRIDADCQALFGKPPSGFRTNACANGHRLVMPNPCSFPDSDAYAHLLCHELGHANGWPATHGDFDRDGDPARTPSADAQPKGERPAL